MRAGHQLVLFPVQAGFPLDANLLQEVLSQQGMLGKALRADTYAVGEAFLDHITFLGCSPYIELEPVQASEFCHVQLPVSDGRVQFLAGSNVKPPPCPACKAALTDLPGRLQQADKVLAEQHCPACQAGFLPHELNWRKSAVFASNYIVIGNIHEAEAVPEQGLLLALQEATGIGWRHAWLRFA